MEVASALISLQGSAADVGDPDGIVELVVGLGDADVRAAVLVGVAVLLVVLEVHAPTSSAPPTTSTGTIHQAGLACDCLVMPVRVPRSGARALTLCGRYPGW